MDCTFRELKLKVIRLIGDEPVDGSGDTAVYGSQNDAASLKDAIHAALLAICNRYPKSLTFAVTDGQEFDLPTDLIDVEAVLDQTTRNFLPSALMVAGQNVYSGQMSGNVWNTFDQGKIVFQETLTATQTYTVYYSANWILAEDDTDEIEPPDMLMTPLAFFAASYCLMRAAASAGNIRQYATKVDSGNPTDNPLVDLSNFFLHRFELEMQRIPMKQKGTKS